MGSACSRKRGHQVNEDVLYSARFSKSGSFKWLLHTLSRSSSDVQRKAQGPGRRPSLMELCVAKVREYLEVCSGFITDAGVKNIKDLKDMKLLNLSQNGNLTDKMNSRANGL